MEKQEKNIETKLHESAKAVVIILSVVFAIAAIILFCTQIKVSLVIGIAYPIALLSVIPVLWIGYYIILVLCKMSNNLQSLVNAEKIKLKRCNEQKKK